MTTELRDYRIAPGHLDEFLAAWRDGVVPLRRAHGFTIDGAWVAGEDRFIWLLSLEAGQEEFEKRNAAYYADPARARLDPDPAQWIEEMRTHYVQSVEIPPRL